MEQGLLAEVDPPRLTPKGWRWDVVLYRGTTHVTAEFGYENTEQAAQERIRSVLDRR